jgi:hypothetical protein
VPASAFSHREAGKGFKVYFLSISGCLAWARLARGFAQGGETGAWRGFVETIGEPCKCSSMGWYLKSKRSLLEMMDLLREENLSTLDNDPFGLKQQDCYGRNRESPLRGSQKTKNRQY